MRSKGLTLAAAAVLLLAGGIAGGAEDSLVQLERADKAMLIPSGETGEVTVYASVEPTSPEARRYRYTYHVYYREGVPSIYPYSRQARPGSLPIVGVDLQGDPDCDYSAVAAPARRQNGPWVWGVHQEATISWDTPSRRWMPDGGPLAFTFTSVCAPGTGRVYVRLSHDEDGERAFSMAAGIMVPGVPPVRTSKTRDRAPAGPTGRSYAQPSRRR